jgi:ATP-dependent DNA helicase RecQ
LDFTAFLNRSDESDGEAFRSWFGHVGEIRSLVPGTPMMARTATATKEMQRKIKKLLQMDSPMELSDSPNRNNIVILVDKHSSSTDVFSSICHKIDVERENYPRTLVFCKTILDVSKVYIAITDSLIVFTDVFTCFILKHQRV